MPFVAAPSKKFSRFGDHSLLKFASGILLTLLLSSFSSVFADTRIGLWRETPLGTVETNSFGIQSDRDLKLQPSNNAYFILDAKPFDSRYAPVLRFQYARIKAEGTGITFFGRNRSNIELQERWIGFHYRIPIGAFYLAAGLNLLDVEGRVDFRNNNRQESADIDLRVPTLYFAASGSYRHRVEALFEYEGMRTNDDKFADIRGSISVKMLPRLSLEAGYRRQNILVTTRSTRSDFRFSGPFGGVILALGDDEE